MKFVIKGDEEAKPDVIVSLSLVHDEGVVSILAENNKGEESYLLKFDDKEIVLYAHAQIEGIKTKGHRNHVSVLKE